MKHILTAVLFSSILFTSCTKELDLDEDTLILVDKQEKLATLDDLYDLSFEDPIQAEIDYDNFVRNELITETQNYLLDLDISNRNSMTSLAVQLNSNAEVISSSEKSSLFEIFKYKFESQMLSQTLYGELPQQLKTGERLDKFQNKIQEIETLFDEKITDFRENSPIDKTITDKEWNLQTSVFTFIPAFKLYNINFNFKLNTDKSMDILSFFFMPHIPKSGTLLGVMEEPGFFIEEVSPNITSPYQYAVYDNKICFYFKFKNNYDYGTESGKLAREWCYEYEYKLEDNNLILFNPQVILYMPPIMRITGYENPDF